VFGSVAGSDSGYSISVKIAYGYCKRSFAIAVDGGSNSQHPSVYNAETKLVEANMTHAFLANRDMSAL